MTDSFPISAWRQTWLRIVSPLGEAWAVHPAEEGKMEGEFPYESPIHVITAWNPESTKLTYSENGDRHRRLQIQLQGLGEEIWEGTGSAIDGQWAEEGFARVGTSLESSLAIGCQWKQDSIWEWSTNGLAAIECISGVRHQWGWVLAALPSRQPFDDLEGMIRHQ